ncbi:monooxygenase fad-binding protein [Diplodia corticola]|uniref:Monooxygenase fad-binding protein n=1 Tax=Diplodia corticola TaxID=236234 RepID=A0A1J9QS26_9PEZI|nr:monooxygenase fad-binding protein [Diplodia corticola]OJD31225.1 monooxygenase fad-binding protein [Diplodia corticola]
MSSSAPRIAIIGAGPAGLCLARLLQLHSINSTVFEKDGSAAHRAAAGGSLDLHEDSGQAALREAGLWDEFQRLARYDGQAYIISDHTGHRYCDTDADGIEDLGRPEIDRSQLRRMLLDSLAPGTVRWGHKLSRAEPDGTLHFDVNVDAVATTEDDDGAARTENAAVVVEERGFDLVVGADGARSRIRPLLTTVPPMYSGLTGYELRLPADIDAANPSVSRLVGNGSHFAFGQSADNQRCLCLQRQSDRSVCVYAFVREHAGWHARNGVADHADVEAVRRLLLDDVYAGWAEGYKDVLRAAMPGWVLKRELWMMHVGTRWVHREGFTAVGDAAHLMTPFAGEGVNVALGDALVLAREVAGAVEAVGGGGAGGGGVDVGGGGGGAVKRAVDGAVERYEKEMFPRAREFMQATWDSMMERFEPGGNEKFAEGFRALAEERKNREEGGKGEGKDGDRVDALFRRE